MCNLMEMTIARSALETSTAWVRPANLLDVDAIARIHNQYVDAGPYTMEEDRWTPFDVKQQLDHFTDREGYVVAEDTEGVIQGWGKVKQYSPRAGYRTACEMSTYIDREGRGKGVGDAVMTENLKLAKRMGYHHAVARIIDGNHSSLRFHLKHGFEIVGVQKEIGMVDGKFADVILLQRIL